LLTFTG